MLRNLSLLTLLAFAVPALRGQDTRATAPSEPSALRLDDAEARLRDVEKATGLDESQRAELSQVWRSVVDLLRGEEADRRKTADFVTAVTGFEPRKKALLEALAALPERLANVPVEDGSLAAAERALGVARTALESERAYLARLEAELQERSSHRAKLPEAQAAAKRRLEELERLGGRSGSGSGGSPLDAARKSLQIAERQKLLAELALYEAEERAFEPRGELLRLEIDRARRSATLHEGRAVAQNRIVEERRGIEGERAAEEARKAKESQMQQNSLLAPIAAENARLAALRAGSDGIPAKVERATRELRFLQEAKTHYTAEFAKTREYVRVAARSDALGTLLVNRRGMLAKDLDVREIERRALQRKAELADAQFKSLLFEEQRAQLAETERVLLRSSPIQEEAERWKAIVKDVTGKQLDLLTSLARDYDAWFQALVDLEATSVEVTTLVKGYERYIDERVLWTPSAAPLWSADWELGLGVLGRTFAATTWQDLVSLVASDLTGNVPLYVIVLIVVGAMLLLRRRGLARIPELGRLAAQGSTVAFLPTVLASWWTIVAAAFWPFLIAVVGYLVWRQSWAWEFPETQRLAFAAGSALLAAALAFFAASAFRLACMEKGLGEAHFGWAARATQVVRREFGWIMLVGVPLVAAIRLLSMAVEGRRGDVLERALFVLAMLCMAVFAHRVARPRGGALDEYCARAPSSWFSRSKWLFWLVAATVPIAFATLAVIGWHHTAAQLSTRLQFSVWILYAAILMQSLLLRWFTLTRRRLAMEQLRRQLHAERIRNEVGVAPPEVPAAESPHDVDLSAIGAQTLGLVRLLVGIAALVGLWFVWVDVLPALGVLEHVNLWTVARPVIEAGATTAVTRSVPVTLADALLALLIVAVTFTAVRNVPGLFQLTLLNRVALQTGERYAITSVARYVITIVGILIAFSRIGVGWDQVQWLAAAATLGLGFGLQEIFANFVSGLILLFERPIRVGDIVTIGDVEGRVTKIRMRATTIVDGDRRELIVPNRDLVTGKVSNWTLTDSTSRVQIAVGVAYGSDVQLVQRVLLRCAHDNPHTLKDPAPEVVFDAFGPSSLDFRLRVFIAAREDNTRIRSMLHQAIEKALREAGVEIPFPQHEVHIKSMPGAVTPPPAKP